jgi:hypothetical protein
VQISFLLTAPPLNFEKSVNLAKTGAGPLGGHAVTTARNVRRVRLTERQPQAAKWGMHEAKGTSGKVHRDGHLALLHLRPDFKIE